MRGCPCVLSSVWGTLWRSHPTLPPFSVGGLLARRAEGQAAEITAADQACDSQTKPFCLDSYSQHTEPCKHGNEKTSRIIKTRLCSFRLLNCPHWVLKILILRFS